jgi:hypothetical protein
VRLEGLLREVPTGEGSSERRPLREEAPRAPESGDALAREHLDEAGIDGQIRRAVGEALSAVRDET